ncbi:hypothetical protein ACWDR5_19535 [Streptomyces koyangensis]
MWTLVSYLPEDSALAREMAGDDAGWNLQTMLLATLHDRLAEANWQRGSGKGPRPKPIPRPGVGSDRIGVSKRDTAEIAAFLAALQPEGGDS